jgi:hypothetical protein
MRSDRLTRTIIGIIAAIILVTLIVAAITVAG